jgi:hypothetical protein
MIEEMASDEEMTRPAVNQTEAQGVLPQSLPLVSIDIFFFFAFHVYLLLSETS